jgi:hypothetical protein
MLPYQGVDLAGLGIAAGFLTCGFPWPAHLDVP